MTTRLIICFFCILLPATGWGQSEQTIVVDDGKLEIPIQRYTALAENAPILLWLPSSRGTSPTQAITATTLADIDIETWVVDLHLAYFVAEGRGSAEHFRPQDIAELIQIAAGKTHKKVFVLATDSVAVPALKAIAIAQRRAAQENNRHKLGGVFLFHPKLTYPASKPGEPAHYRPIALHSTIPIYYIQPSISTRQWYNYEIVKTLQSGGADVFYQPLPGVAAGYHLRPDDELSDEDITQREALPKMIKGAMQLLGMLAIPEAPQVLSAEEPEQDTTQRFGLKKLAGNRAKLLSLLDLNDQSRTVDYAQNKLSLVSFWASWCQPCIKELPSLARLKQDFAPKGLQIITINVGEAADEIQKTINRFKMSAYLNLRDPQGETMLNWNVHGFPSNFIVNQGGDLVYGSFGAVEWDDENHRALIASLLSANNNATTNQ